MKPKYLCLIIDHDDTAVDSTAKIHYPAHLKVMSHLRPDEKPVTLEEWFLKNFHPGIMAYLTQELGMDAQEMELEYEIWKQFTQRIVPEFYPGFIEALIEYKKKGGLVAVVSHSEKQIIEKHYAAHENGFLPDMVFGWDYNEELRKPSPLPVLEILKAFQLKPQEALIVDDLKPGVLMGKATGVDVAAAGWGHNISEIREYMRKNCVAYFDNVGAFKDFILG
jgi:HAD superfamily hydrolase (TIGR01509 family)